MNTPTSENIINNFKQFDNFFKQNIKMLVALSNDPKRLMELEDAVYSDETNRLGSELSMIIKEFREKNPKTLRDKLKVLRWRLN